MFRIAQPRLIAWHVKVYQTGISFLYRDNHLLFYKSGCISEAAALLYMYAVSSYICIPHFPLPSSIFRPRLKFRL